MPAGMVGPITSSTPHAPSASLPRPVSSTLEGAKHLEEGGEYPADRDCEVNRHQRSGNKHLADNGLSFAHTLKNTSFAFIAGTACGNPKD